MVWKVTIITLFPEIFPGPLQYSLAGKAKDFDIWSIDVINLRDFATDQHKTVDDKMFGGGTGMVIKPDVLSRAIDYVLSHNNIDDIIYFSPRGSLFNQNSAKEYSIKSNLLLICGRYEGVDQRVIEKYNIKEISMGDFILSGGEIAAITFIDSCVRLLNNVIKNNKVHEEESFAPGTEFEFLLEYPHYTRPAIWNGVEVPKTLLSGNHAEINKWRLNEAKRITSERRPDLWEKYNNKDNEK